MKRIIIEDPVNIGAWRSLEARLLWEQEVPSSNLGAPTISFRNFPISDKLCTLDFTKSHPTPRATLRHAKYLSKQSGKIKISIQNYYEVNHVQIRR